MPQVELIIQGRMCLRKQHTRNNFTAAASSPVMSVVYTLVAEQRVSDGWACGQMLG
jgi:hypothetical protein